MTFQPMNILSRIAATAAISYFTIPGHPMYPIAMNVSEFALYEFLEMRNERIAKMPESPEKRKYEQGISTFNPRACFLFSMTSLAITTILSDFPTAVLTVGTSGLGTATVNYLKHEYDLYMVHYGI